MTTETQRVNSLGPGDAYKCLWTGSPLDQMMACCLISSKPFIWINVGILSIGPLETNFSEILIKIQIISFKERYLKLSTAKWWPFWLSLNVLKLGGINSTSQIAFSSWGQHGAHLGPVGPRWAPCWPHEPCHQGCFSSTSISWVYKVTVMKDQFTCTTANRDKIAFASLKILFVIPVLHIFWYALFGANIISFICCIKISVLGCKTSIQWFKLSWAMLYHLSAGDSELMSHHPVLWGQWVNVTLSWTSGWQWVNVTPSCPRRRWVNVTPSCPRRQWVNVTPSCPVGAVS